MAMKSLLLLKNKLNHITIELREKLSLQQEFKSKISTGTLDKHMIRDYKDMIYDTKQTPEDNLIIRPTLEQIELNKEMEYLNAANSPRVKSMKKKLKDEASFSALKNLLQVQSEADIDVKKKAGMA